MSNIWDEDQEEFRDIPPETTKDFSHQYQAPTPRQRPQGDIVTTTQNARDVGLIKSDVPEEIDLESLGIEEEDDFTAVLNDANLRIEQGRLYQMIMNHDLFDGMESDPKAVHNVQREIRKFARESMEVMLGMRETTPVHAAIASPFNDLEVDILKKIASKATNGATESAEANEVAAVVKQAPKRQTINTIGGSTALKKSAAPQQKVQTKLPTKAATPIKRTKLDLTIDQICAEEGIPRELLEESYKPLNKSVENLNEDELLSRAKDTAKRLSARKTVKSATALPMASFEQQELLAMQRANQMSQAPGMAALLARVNTMPVKN